MTLLPRNSLKQALDRWNATPPYCIDFRDSGERLSENRQDRRRWREHHKTATFLLLLRERGADVGYRGSKHHAPLRMEMHVEIVVSN
jgi:hypothetical protein